MKVKGHAGVSQGQSEVMLLRNALWLPNLVAIGHFKGHAGVSQGQSKVMLLRNALWLPNLVG